MLRIAISRCRSLLNTLEEADWPDRESASQAANLVHDAKNALLAAENCSHR